jgi:hypothetical protein
VKNKEAEVIPPELTPIARQIYRCLVRMLRKGTASTTWKVRGEPIAEQEVHRVQWQWYRDNPWLVDAGYARHAETLKVLQLA